MISVPLISPAVAVISRLDIATTWAQNPAGAPSVGYDERLREPYPTASGASPTIADTRQYMAAVRIKVQIEMPTFDELNMQFLGSAPDSRVVLVAHNQELTTLGLIVSGRCLLKAGDKISSIEKPGGVGTPVLHLERPLYVHEVRPASHGFGALVHDLQLIYTTNRAKNMRG